MAPRLQDHYEEAVRPALMEQFGYDSPMRIPRLTKIVVNIGLGEALENPKAVDAAITDLRAITGQEPIKTIARKSVANFKLREGRVIGIKVTLRREKAWAFLDRLMNVALPRTRDFRGISPKSFDGRGNYTLGLSEQLIFPELNYDQIDKVRGMEISIVTTAETDEEGREMLRLLGMPFVGLEVSAPEYARA